MDPLEFCDLCFQRGKPNLSETYKNTFTKTSSLHFSQQTRLEKLLNKLEITPRLVDRRWTCVMDSQKRKEFLDSLWGIGASVHTIDDHVKVLTRLYKPETRTLGSSIQIDLPRLDSWSEFNPTSRNWNEIHVNKKNGKLIAKASLGNILRCSTLEETIYFRTNLDGARPVLVPMEKRAALNIMSTFAEPIEIKWKADSTGEHGFIENKLLDNIPDEILNIMQRLGTKDKRMPEMLIFENNDYELVKTTLGLIKINLVKSSEVLNALSDKTSEIPVMIKDVERKRLQVLLNIIKELGGIVESKEDHLVICGKHGLVNLTFADSDKSTQDGTAIKISISALEEPSRFVQILSMIKKRLGLFDMPLENMTSQHWPIITDSDMQYVVQSAISWYSSNPALASNIISEGDKFDKVKGWYSKIKEGKIRSNLDTITLGKIIKQKESTK